MIQVDARKIPIADKSVQMVVTSPPYFGLRSYDGDQDSVWGGDPDCHHRWVKHSRILQRGTESEKQKKTSRGNTGSGFEARCGTCARCNAWRGAYGQEPTVEMYVQHSVEILRQIKRVLKDDGVCFWNVGDSYAQSGMGGGRNGDKQSTNAGSRYLGNPYAKKPGTDIPVHINSRRKPPSGLQPKDLCLIPERVAIAAQQDGWIIRNMIIWHKTNPMPCGAKDRCTKSYEHIIVMVKQKKYYWDHEAAQEPQAPAGKKRIALANSRRLEPTDKQFKRSPQCAVRGANTTDGLVKSRRSFTKPGTGRNDVGRVITDNGMRNLRDVWSFNVGNFRGAHFATFPLELPLRCIKLASRPGDIVLDPFNGSGTTAVAAAQLGREYIGLDRAYLDLAAQRALDFEIEAKRTDHAVTLEMIGKLIG